MVASRDKFIPQWEMEGGGGFSSLFGGNAAPEPAYTPPPPPPEPAYTPPPPPPEPAYTPPEVPDYFAQQFSPDMFQTEPTPSFGGYGRDLDDRYYEQMFAKGGLIDLLRRR
jgi:hypothetical protein